MEERKTLEEHIDGVVFAGQPRAVDADIVVPVYNEQAELGSSILMLVEQVRALAARENPVSAQVVIADNASSDKTWDLARHLVQSFPDEVRAVRIPKKGRGRALKLAWGSSRARARAYMDVDLSTDIAQIDELLDPILQGRADISFGSRLLEESQVQRCAKREFISRSYNRMLQGYLGVKFRDAQCGFKAISARTASELLPQVQDDEWFFDTEMLVLGERAGLAMHEFPVRWTEDAGSTVKIVDTVRKDLAGMRRLKRAGRTDAPTKHGAAKTEQAVREGARTLAPRATSAVTAASTTPATPAPVAAAACEEELRVPKRGKLDWVAFIALMAAAFAVFFWNLTASGYANEFYSAAAQAGSQDWEAFFWGSLDAGNAITVDKPPASIWLMALSVRLLGLSSFAILLPQALMGVATTWLLYATVRRYWGNWAGIAAGAVFVVTPVAALMFRFNNPDALLVFLLVAASAAVLRGLEKPAGRSANRRRTAWFALAGLLVGFAFLTKQLQAFLVLPGFALAMFAFSPTRVRRRLADAAVALAAMVVGAGWWVLAGVLVPSGSRPYFGGSQTDSFLELTFSYNGLGRLTGDETGSVVGGGAPGGQGGGMWGETGLLRLFGSDFADQISWFALLAVAGIVLGIVCARLFAKGDVRRRSRGAFIAIFGAWLLVTWIVFSMMAGIFHQYYTVALAPAIAVLTAVCARGAWELRERMWTQVLVFAAAAASVVWAFALVRANGSFDALAWAILAGGLAACAVAFACRIVAWRRSRAPRGAHGLHEASRAHTKRTGRPSHKRALRTCFATACALATVAVFAGPVAWTWATVSTGHTGSIVSAGPAFAMGAGGPGGGGQQGGPGGDGQEDSDGAFGQGGEQPQAEDGQGGGQSAPGDASGFGGQASDGASDDDLQRGGEAGDASAAGAQAAGGQAPDAASGQKPDGQAPSGQSAGGQQPGGAQQQGQAPSGQQPPSGNDDAGQAPSGDDGTRQSGGAGAQDGATGQNGASGSQNGAPGAPSGQDTPEGQGGAPGASGGLGAPGGQGGGGIFGGQTSSELVELMEQNASGYRWAAATTGSQNAAGYQLESGLAVMAIGGFNGSDPAPTLEQFKSYVEQGLVRYYIASGGMGGQQMGGSDAASQIEEWVSANFTAQTLGSATVYDLASANG